MTNAPRGEGRRDRGFAGFAFAAAKPRPDAATGADGSLGAHKAVPLPGGLCGRPRRRERRG